jgi:MFS family permease
MSDVSATSERLAPGAWKILSVVILGSFLSNLDATIVNVSLSSLAGDLNTTLRTVQWVTSGYFSAASAWAGSASPR